MLGANAYPHVHSAADFGRVAVLMGGASAEREVSLMSGTAVLNALLERGVDAHAVDAQHDVVTQLQQGRYARVWIVLHGRGGEDGAMQGCLETLGLPYTGSGVLGSALGMDKIRTKQVFTAAALPTPRWRHIETIDTCAAVAADLGVPLIVKPAQEGSSIGMSKVSSAAELPAAWRRAADTGAPVLAEAWVTGAEYSVAILHGVPLPLIRVDAGNSFYDYDAKYLSNATQYYCPCGLPAELEREYAALALQAYHAVGATGWGRVDFMLDSASNTPQLLEVNTVPGMTSHSLVPMAAAEAGIDFGALCWQILETSFPEQLNRGAKESNGAR
jgi:D-alanine-D-alanine ligase